MLSEDSYLGNRSDPLSLNLYVYCRNNPLIYYDPTGHIGMFTQAQYELLSKEYGIPLAQGNNNHTASHNAIDLVYAASMSGKSTTSSSSNSSSSGSSSATAGWTSNDYYSYADSMGMNRDAVGLFDVIDGLLTTDKGFNTVTNMPIYGGDSKLSYSQSIGYTSISYTDSSNTTQTISTWKNDFYISNDGALVFNNQAAASQMNHNSGNTFTHVPLGSISIMVPTGLVESIRGIGVIVPTPSPTMSASMAAMGFGSTANDVLSDPNKLAALVFLYLVSEQARKQKEGLVQFGEAVADAGSEAINWVNEQLRKTWDWISASDGAGIIAIQTMTLTDAQEEIRKRSSNDPTFIYRTGSGNATNLTPRPLPRDLTGLSYQLTVPSDTSYTITSMELINATGKLIAIQDKANHVAVMPVDMSRMQEWRDSRTNALYDPHEFTITLTEISFRVK